MLFKKIVVLFGIVLISQQVCAERSMNYYYDFGAWFGGDKIADNPDGDNYNAGSGAVFDFGVSFLLFEKYDLYTRNSIGYRYQGSETGSGRNKGLVLESSIVKELRYYNLGFGLHADIASSTSDYFGFETEFQDAFGPFVSFEYMIDYGLGFGLKYHMLDYTSVDGVEYSGDQAGLFITGKF